MAEFVGLPVQVSLLNGQVVEGVIKAVSPETELLLLGDALINDEDGKALTRLPRLELSSDQIADIKITAGKARQSEGGGRVVRQHSAAPVPPPSSFPHLQSTTLAPSKTAISPAKKSKNGTPRKVNADCWSRGDVLRYKQEDFDFQAALSRFDKAKIFEEIRAHDEIRPEERLVAHNLSQRKLRHDQNVLDNRNAAIGDEDEMDKVVLDTSALSLSDVNSMPLSASRKCPRVEKSLLSAIENEVLASGALSNDQMIENGGRSLADFLLSRLSRLPGLLSKGILLILAPDRISSYSLAAARIFLNRGFKVVALPPADSQRSPGYFNSALRQFQKFGGSLVESIDHPCSLVVSATSISGTIRSPTVPVCALAAGISPATWHVRFGLPVELDETNGTTAVCDVGWPFQTVSSFLGGSWDYSRFFDSSSFAIIKE